MQLANGWVVNADTNVDRQQRVDCANKVLSWLESDKQAVYARVQVLNRSLGFEEGDQWQISDFADIPTRVEVGRPDPIEKRFPKKLQDFLHEWASINAPQKWESNTSASRHGGPWLSSDDFAMFVRFLRDALCAEQTFDGINSQLMKVVGLKLRDESAKRRSRRKYVGILLNDFVMNPGPSTQSLDEVESDDEEDFGLMGPFVERWRSRLPQFLASGAGDEVRVPPGNLELQQILEEYT
jgi:hypothetical protein